MKSVVSIGLCIALFMSLAGRAGAVGGARDPFSDDTQNMTVTQKKAKCQADYDLRMRIVEKTYGPAMKKEKETGEALNRDIAVIKAQKVISVAVTALLKVKMTQLEKSRATFERLRYERLGKEKAVKTIQTNCMLDAEKTK